MQLLKLWKIKLIFLIWKNQYKFRKFITSAHKYFEPSAIEKYKENFIEKRNIKLQLLTS